MMVLCKNDNCAHNEEGACSVRGEIQLDESAKCLSSTPVEEKKPEVKSKPLEGVYICLDAGHKGKENRCPAIPEYYESNMNWKLHLLLKNYLEEMGARVIITRPDQNTDKTLYLRGACAKGCNLFLSIHSNAVGNGMNENVDHVAVYHLTEDASTTCDDVSKEVAQVIAPVIANVMGTKQGYKILTRKAKSDRNGDGVLNDNYYGVLHGARMVDVPGLILEHSFHTNSKTVHWLLEDSNLDHLAHAEADAIARYFTEDNVKTEDAAQPSKFYVRVANVEAGDVLNIRKRPDPKSDTVGALAYNDPNKYTIVETSGNWGRLKSGIGWINLRYTVTV